MRIPSALVLSALCTVSVLAAQQSPQKPAAPSPPSQSSATAPKATYTGCLKAGTAADTWTLENAELASAAGTTKPGATATAGATSKMTLGLTVKPSENLKPHTNHKIEVTGTVTPAPSAGGAASGPRQNLNVESVKMVAATCP
jgi:hypothetical protein